MLRPLVAFGKSDTGFFQELELGHIIFSTYEMDDSGNPALLFNSLVRLAASSHAGRALLQLPFLDQHRQDRKDAVKLF